MVSHRANGRGLLTPLRHVLNNNAGSLHIVHKGSTYRQPGSRQRGAVIRSLFLTCDRIVRISTEWFAVEMMLLQPSISFLIYNACAADRAMRRGYTTYNVGGCIRVLLNYLNRAPSAFRLGSVIGPTRFLISFCAINPCIESFT